MLKRWKDSWVELYEINKQSGQWIKKHWFGWLLFTAAYTVVCAWIMYRNWVKPTYVIREVDHEEES